MSGDRGFTRREITAVVVFAALAAAIGIGSYRAGVGVAHETGGGAIVTAAAGETTVNGQALYASSCAGCHGGQAQGGVGPSLAESAAWSEPDFNAAVLHGQAPGGRTLAPVMPRFAESGLNGEEATPERIEAIHTYVKGLQ
ncbi:c-type cytochrome [Deinococcus sp. NW-56]|uniref:c-type cytochrome n=1 Tax=Deinococcus sp. NW-56 TaxID=2080419 RepID=UPI000CF4FEA1|nr:c-type cytochrome [Deinococcus sp. NW-56]